MGDMAGLGCDSRLMELERCSSRRGVSAEDDKDEVEETDSGRSMPRSACSEGEEEEVDRLPEGEP